MLVLDHSEAKRYCSAVAIFQIGRNWSRKREQVQIYAAYIQIAQTQKLIVPAFESTEALISVKSSPENPLVVCLPELYRKVHTSTHVYVWCKPKFGQPFSRHSPEAETMSMPLGITSTSNLLVSCPDVHAHRQRTSGSSQIALRMQFYQTN